MATKQVSEKHNRQPEPIKSLVKRDPVKDGQKLLLVRKDLNEFLIDYFKRKSLESKIGASIQ